MSFMTDWALMLCHCCLIVEPVTQLQQSINSSLHRTRLQTFGDVALPGVTLDI